MGSARSIFEIVFFFFVQTNFEVKMYEIEHGLPLIDTTNSQISGVPSKPELPDHCAVHTSRIVDLESRVSTLNDQTRTAMEQAKKSSDLSK
jgi:hypothetical protein